MPLIGSVGFFQRALDRVFGDLYSDPMFRMVDPSYLHFPLAIESAPQQKLGARLARIPVHEEASSSDSDSMDVQEVIEIEDSEDSDDEQEYHTTSVMNLGRKRKLRRAVHRRSSAEKKRPRDEPNDYMSDDEEDSFPSNPSHSDAFQGENAAPTAAAAEREPETKKVKPSDVEDDSRMDVTPTANADSVGLFGWKPEVNLAEHEDHFIISARLPGFGQNDVSLDLDEYDGKSHPFVKLTAQKSLEKEDGSELSSVKFVRLIPVPAAVSLQNISASWEEGSLKVTIQKPKPAEAPKAPVRIEIANQQ